MKSSTVFAVIIAVVATSLFTVLLWQQLIAGGYYVVLMTITALVTLVIYGFTRLKELDLKNLKLTLEKAEEVKREIYAKENDLKKAATVFARLILFVSNWRGVIGSEKSLELTERWTQQRVDELLDSFEIPQKEISDVCWFYETRKRMQSLDRDDPKRGELWNDLLSRLEADCESFAKRGAKRVKPKS